MNPEINATGSVPVQTFEPELPRLCRNGLTIVKRSNKPNAKYMVRIKFRGKVHELTLAETAKESFEIAVRARREIQGGRFAELRASTAMRRVNPHTLREVFVLYRQFEGPDRPSEATRELNIHAITAIVRDVHGAQLDVNNVSLDRLTPELVWKWKEIKRKLASDAENDERAAQLLRSANSRLRQAKSIFAENEDLRTFYRFHKLALPAELEGFCKEPPFGDCNKDEYHPPADDLVAKTFAGLETFGASSNPDQINMYKACWLAIGFGLRKSEISVAKNSWFVNIGGVIFCRGDVLAKNKKFPEVRVQLGAWDKIGKLIEDAQPQSYVLSGSLTERDDVVFRRISEWMRNLGWKTSHHIHEFRAWAGCQIAMAPGNDIREAQAFLRHASFGTTERFYGHHLKIKLTEVKLSVPQITPPKEFVPVVLPTPAARA